MQWYVSRNGRTTGPVSEEQMIADARAGNLAGTMVRDEHSSAWVPVEQSPFVFGAAQQNSGASLAAIVALLIFGGCVGVLWYACNSFNEHTAQYERERKEEQSAKERAQRSALKRYSAIMTKMTKDPPVTLKDVQSAMGRKADTCKRTDDQNMDVCHWFMTKDSSIKVFSYTLAADNLAGSDPEKWVKLVVFGRDGNVEKRIDGAMQQIFDSAE